jgi:hypothetical protein
MAVYKYKTLEEARSALWCREPDAAYFIQLRSLWALANRLSHFSYPSGVFKYATIEEANEQRREWDLSNARKTVSSALRSSGTEGNRAGES